MALHAQRLAGCGAGFSGKRVAPAARAAAASRATAPPALSRRRAVGVEARAVVKDAKSGAEFPLAQKFWEGEEMHCLGAGTRVKKVLVVGVPVYSVAAFAEGERAAKELGIRARGGFFEGDGDYCAALLDGAFGKALMFRLLRDITGQQFADAIDEALGPRLRLAGAAPALQQFTQFFGGRQLPKGATVVLVWPLPAPGKEAVLSGDVVAPGEERDLVATAPPLRIESPALARALFELFLGDDSVVPDARAVFASGARELVDSDAVTRAARKQGA